jgi:hypothetical protein
MSAVDDIIGQLPMSALASRVGSDEQSTEQAVRQVLPTLLGGLAANAQDPAGAQSLAGALGQHSSSLVRDGVDLDQVDTADGSKIVSNVFGGQSDQVVQALGGSLGGQEGLVQRLLPILAPIVLSYITQRLGGRTQAAQSGGGLADVLGGLLAGQPGGGSGGGLGDLLGGLLGGGQQGQQGQQRSGGGLADVLGGLLGGGRR